MPPGRWCTLATCHVRWIYTNLLIARYVRIITFVEIYEMCGLWNFIRPHAYFWLLFMIRVDCFLIFSQLVCKTPAYQVDLTVLIVKVVLVAIDRAEYAQCPNNNCRFQYRADRTPIIQLLQHGVGSLERLNLEGYYRTKLGVFSSCLKISLFLEHSGCSCCHSWLCVFESLLLTNFRVLSRSSLATITA